MFCQDLLGLADLFEINVLHLGQWLLWRLLFGHIQFIHLHRLCDAFSKLGCQFDDPPLFRRLPNEELFKCLCFFDGNANALPGGGGGGGGG